MPDTPTTHDAQLAATSSPRYYLCEAWDHIFPDLVLRSTRFVLDLTASPPALVCVDLLEGWRGWERLDGDDWVQDLLESLHDNQILTDLDILRAGGTPGPLTLADAGVLTDTLPAWATPADRDERDPAAPSSP